MKDISYIHIKADKTVKICKNAGYDRVNQS